jgi:hypothetical protein
MPLQRSGGFHILYAQDGQCGSTSPCCAGLRAVVSPSLLCLAYNVLQSIAPFLWVAIGYILVRLPAVLSVVPACNTPFVQARIWQLRRIQSSWTYPFSTTTTVESIRSTKGKLPTVAISTSRSSDTLSSSCGKSPWPERVMPPTSKMSPNSKIMRCRAGWESTQDRDGLTSETECSLRCRSHGEVKRRERCWSAEMTRERDLESSSAVSNCWKAVTTPQSFDM